MMVFVKNHNRAVRCVFKGGCNHAPATHISVHEFVNHPDKPLCDHHTQLIKAMMGAKV